MKRYYEIDNNGKIIADFGYNQQNDSNQTIIHTTPPPPTMLKPRWVGDAATRCWMDVATCAEHEAHVDRLTDMSIKRWVLARGKNESYYINCGIRVALLNITDTTSVDYRHYHEYRAFVEQQVKMGRAKKEALVV